MTALAAQDVSVFVEIGPDGTLSALGAGGGHDGAVFVPALRPGEPGPAALLTALARAHAQGLPVNWAAVLGGGRRVDLPTYAFARQRYWPQPVPRPVSGDGWRYRTSWVPVSEPDHQAPVRDVGSVVAPAGQAGARTCGSWSPAARR